MAKKPPILYNSMDEKKKKVMLNIQQIRFHDFLPGRL